MEIKEKDKCNSCFFPVGEENLKIHTKNGVEFHFCEFCSDSFVGNSFLYTTVNMTNRNVLQTIAYSHNLIMKKLKELDEKITNLCRKS